MKKILVYLLFIFLIIAVLVSAKPNGVPFQELWDAIFGLQDQVDELKERVAELEEGPPSAVCGNLIVEAGEECDDGNTVDGDDCSATCQLETCTTHADCNDGLFCNGVEICLSGSCQAGTFVDCSGSDTACGTGACDEASNSCIAYPLPAGLACGTFTGGVCDADDYCDGVSTSCYDTYQPDGTACDDGDLCTTSDSCSGNGVCDGGVPVNCDDNNVCTIESCNPSSGCEYSFVADTTPCGPSGEVCQSGICA